MTVTLSGQERVFAAPLALTDDSVVLAPQPALKGG